MSTLYAGPWNGEFGWELMGWQANIREIARGFDRVVIGCRESSKALYEDFADEFVLVPSGLNTCGCRCIDRPVPRTIRSLFAGCGRVPGNRFVKAQCFRPAKHGFIRFGDENYEDSFGIVMHARDVPVGGTRNWSVVRNWPLDRWTELARSLGDRVSMCSIGNSEDSMHIPGTFDCRDTDLRVLMNILASSDLFVGPLSGPAHLAALSKCPMVVWTKPCDRQPHGSNTKKRLVYDWNPFHVPVCLIPEYRPPVARVIECVIKAS